jgi:hypothetical protein
LRRALAVGIAGFGDTPSDAVADFNANWSKALGEPRMITDEERRAHGIVD